MVSTGQCPACYSTNSYSATNCLDCKQPLPWGNAVADLKKQIDAANALNAQLQTRQPVPTNGPPPLPTRPVPQVPIPVSQPTVMEEEASDNVYHAFAQAFIGYLAEPFTYLDKNRAAWFGVACMVGAIICTLVGTHLLTQDLVNLMHSLWPFPGAAAATVAPTNPFLPPDPNAVAPTVAPESSSGIESWKLMAVALAPWVSILLTCTLARSIFGREQRDFQGDVFIAGVTMLPFGVVTLLAGMVGYANWQVSAVLFIFALTYTTLFLYRGLTTISAVRDMAAAICVPLVIVESLYLIKFILLRLITV